MCLAGYNFISNYIHCVKEIFKQFTTMKTILLAVDFPDNITPLFDKTLALAQAFNSKVWILHVAPPEPDFVGYDPGPQEVRDGVAKDLRKDHVSVQKLGQLFKDQGVETEALLVQGSTAETIVNEAEKLNADLLVFGSHQSSFFRKLLLGDTAKDIIRKANIPMLVIPLGPDE